MTLKWTFALHSLRSMLSGYLLHATQTRKKNKNIKKHPLCLVFSCTRLYVVFLCSGIVALIEALSQLQVVEPHLQECVDVTRCTQVCKTNKCVLEEGWERNMINCLPVRYSWYPELSTHSRLMTGDKRQVTNNSYCVLLMQKTKQKKTLSRRSEFGSSMLWKAFSSISPSHACSPIPTRQLGFPLQFLLEKEVMINVTIPVPTFTCNIQLSPRLLSEDKPNTKISPMYQCCIPKIHMLCHYPFICS